MGASGAGGGDIMSTLRGGASRLGGMAQSAAMQTAPGQVLQSVLGGPRQAASRVAQSNMSQVAVPGVMGALSPQQAAVHEGRGGMPPTMQDINQRARDVAGQMGSSVPGDASGGGDWIDSFGRLMEARYGAPQQQPQQGQAQFQPGIGGILERALLAARQNPTQYGGQIRYQHW